MSETATTGMDAYKKTQEKIRDNLSKTGKIIAIMSGKGGVGKTTVAVNLSISLAKAGKHVGILDIDLHGPNVSKMLGLEGKRPRMDHDRIVPVRHESGVDVFSLSFLIEDPDSPVIWRGPMKINAINQFLGDVNWGNLDYLIIDLPPGTGDEALSVAQSIPGAGAIVVTTPQDVALLDSRKSIGFARSLDMNLEGVVENMSGMACPHCGKDIDLFSTGGGEKAASELSAPFLGRIPIDPDIVKGGDSGKPIVETDVKTGSSKAFNSIAQKIIGEDET